MDLVNQILRLSRRAGGGHPQRLAEAAVRASRCEEIGLDLVEALRLREGDGHFQRLAVAAARRFETPSSSSTSTLPPPTSSSTSTLPPPTSSSSSSVSAGAINSPSWKPPTPSSFSISSPAWSWNLPSTSSLSSTRGMLPSTSSLSSTRGMSSALHSRGYTSTWLLPQDVDNLPELPPVSELSYDRGDSRPEMWVPSLEFFKLHHDPFPDPPADGSCARSLSTDLFREMKRDLVKLVAVNRRRGYDLAQDLTPENVLVCIGTGRIKLGVVSGNLITNPTDFKGYVAVGLLLDTILSIHGSKLISEDNIQFHNLLTWCAEDERILNDASLLSRFGRLGLTLRISMLFENDLQKILRKGSSSHMHEFFQSLPYTSLDLDVFPTDSMHASFLALRRESSEFKDQDRTYERNNLTNAKKDPRKAWLSVTGKWLVRLNRNGVMHPPRGFKQWQAIDMLHSHTPLYLPEAQEFFRKRKGWWETLEMGNYFPEKK